jgi:hypothetical protein
VHKIIKCSSFAVGLKELLTTTGYEGEANAEEKRDAWKEELLLSKLFRGGRNGYLLPSYKKISQTLLRYSTGNDCANKEANLQ